MLSLEKTNNVLQKKMELLNHLQKGQYQKVYQILPTLCQSNMLNNNLYIKFRNFMNQNLKGVLQMQKQEQMKKQNPIKIEDGEDNQKQFDSENWSLSESQSQQDQIQTEGPTIKAKTIPLKQKSQDKRQLSKNKLQHQCSKQSLKSNNNCLPINKAKHTSTSTLKITNKTSISQNNPIQKQIVPQKNNQNIRLTKVSAQSSFKLKR